MIEIDLVRHGRTVFNEERRVQGMANSELTPAGKQNAIALGHGLALAGKEYDAVYASDLTRASDTAKLVLQGMGDKQTVKIDEGLREENYGHYEGWLVDDYARDALGVPNFKNAIATGRYTLEQIADKTRVMNADQTPNTAEDAAMVVKRLDDALRGIAEHAEQTGALRTMVVSHGTALLMWLTAAGKGVAGLEMLHNVSLSTVYYDRGEFQVVDIDNLTYMKRGLAAQQ